MRIKYVSILPKSKGRTDRWIIYIPSRYSIHNEPCRISSHYKSGLPFDSKNHAGEVALKIAEAIDEKEKIDPTFWKIEKPDKYIFRKFFQTWLDSKVGASKATIKQYKYNLKQIFPYWKDKDLRHISRYETVEFTQKLQGENSTKNKIIEQINDIFRRANEWHDLDIPLVKKLKTKPKDKVAVDEGVRRLVLSKMDEHHVKIFRFIFMTGCRPSEAMDLQFPLINWDSKTAYIREPKEGKGKEIRLDLLEDLIPMLRELHDSANDKEGYVFRNKHNKKYDHATLHFILKKASAGITDLSLKDLARGTTITRLIKDYGLLEAMAQVGHSQIATTQKYVGIPSVRSIKPKVVFTTFHQTQKRKKKV